MPSSVPLLGLAAGAFCVATAAAQCVAPASDQSLATQFTGTRSIGSPDPVHGANAFFDLIADQDLLLRGFAVQCLDNGTLAVGGSVLPDLRGQLGEFDLWSTPGTAVGRTAPGTGGTTPATPPGWTLLGSVQAVIQGQGQPTAGAFAVPVPLAAGSYGMAITWRRIAAGQPDAGAALHPRYTDPSQQSVPLIRGDQFVTLTAIGVQAAAWTGPLQQPSVGDLRLDYSIQGASAWSRSYGFGCYDRKRTFYESWAGPLAPAVNTPDLAAGGVNGLDLAFTGTSYVVTLNAAPGLAQPFQGGAGTGFSVHVNALTPRSSGTASTNAWDDAISPPIALPFRFRYPGDDGVGASEILVSSNGAVYLDGTSARTFGFYDDYPGLLSGSPVLAPAWTDLEPPDRRVASSPGAGDIWVDSDGASYVAVTWDGVPEWGVAANTNTVQVVLYQGGDVQFRYGTLRHSDAPLLIGFSPGRGVPDPGVGLTPRREPDLSLAADGAGYPSGDGATPARIGLAARPVVGRPLTIRTVGVDPSAVANVTLISAAPAAGVDLGFVGMPDCAAFLALPELVALFQGGAGPYEWTPTQSIPAGLVGATLFAQSAQFSVAVPSFNPSNLLLSDAVCLHVDVN
ncbi:MAG: hypothetical protein AB7O97_06765 [Planctomycetota bacterium]